jgi:hypothetical protein
MSRYFVKYSMYSVLQNNPVKLLVQQFAFRTTNSMRIYFVKANFAERSAFLRNFSKLLVFSRNQYLKFYACYWQERTLFFVPVTLLYNTVGT